MNKLRPDDKCNIVFVGVVDKFENFDRRITTKHAVSFDSAWKPIYWYESYDDNMGPLNSNMLLVYPNGFITVDVNWGPPSFKSKEELANFVASTIKLELISGTKTGLQIEKIGNFRYSDLLSSDIYNNVMTKAVNNMMIHNKTLTDLRTSGDVPDWFFPIYLDRVQSRKPLIITQEEINRRDY